MTGVQGLSVLTPQGRKILDGVDLDLRPGSVTALIGPSGSGKSTLAQALVGHLGPGLRRTAGTVEVRGHDPFTASGRAQIRGRLAGYLPQDPASALDPRRRVLAQLLTAARTAHPKTGREHRNQLVRTAIATASFDPNLLRRHPAQLSGGQAQRALLAWTFVTRPGLLILDEPTSGLDPGTAAQVQAAFTTLPWQPAVLVISHDHDLVAARADQILELDDGHRRVPAASPKLRQPQAITLGSRPRSVVLEASGIVIERGGRRLLDDVTLTVGTAEMIAVQGISGSGKTSLARALCGFAPPARGTLRVHGTQINWDAAVRARRRQPFIAYVGQDALAALNPHETVRRTLHRAMNAAARAGRPAGADPISDLALPQDVLDRTPARLSGGQRHRVALARALASAPDVLVCDETTAALDATTTSHILDALDGWREKHRTPMVLITHTPSVAARAGRVLTITGGRLR
ncbi:ATP-binding cassette domain-containing protein [Kineosporia mesophila]|uniref:ATP-binding cassette domain-containing protein n=1 Tax=Kineosporia mesophila TaxID=566012 RepID=A0ABP6ZD93_9ACTN|nr:ATP-binding cassette domain-containing protein [Kineosporia mesophila]MCD5351934.1 ATP-binding cassette domain-containing protein [Kineosporia mesophila]